MSKRPTGSNADEWQLWLVENRLTGNAPYLAVQIVEAMEEHQRAVWRPITSADVGKTMLVTNNLKARDAFGEMSHRWLIWIQKADKPKETGEYVGYADGDHLVHNLTHCAPAAGASEQDAEDAGARRNPSPSGVTP